MEDALEMKLEEIYREWCRQMGKGEPTEQEIQDAIVEAVMAVGTEEMEDCLKLADLIIKDGWSLEDVDNFERYVIEHPEIRTTCKNTDEIRELALRWKNENCSTVAGEMDSDISEEGMGTKEERDR